MSDFMAMFAGIDSVDAAVTFFVGVLVLGFSISAIMANRENLRYTKQNPEQKQSKARKPWRVR